MLFFEEEGGFSIAKIMRVLKHFTLIHKHSSLFQYSKNYEGTKTSKILYTNIIILKIEIIT